MAAFIEGRLPADEVATVAAHLRDCADCRVVVAETARFAREERPAAAAPARRPWPSWLAAAAVLALVAINVPLLLRWNESRRASVAHLIAYAPREHRTIEPRLSGFPWARMQAPPRGNAVTDPADLKMNGAAGDVLDETKGRREPEARRAAGVAYLLIGRRSESIVALEQAAGNDAKTWNDLAAARYAAAVEDERPSQLPEALADADRALRLDPRNAEALFNRALILEHLGVREQAREAWKRYLDVDPGSGWAVEARTHLRALESTSRRFAPSMLDGMPAAALVREFPQEARMNSEGELLSRWGDAVAAGNEPLASATLSRAHAVGDALAAFRGEHLLRDAVAAIERSSASTRQELAEAHRVYRRAREEYAKRNAGNAEPQFRHAADLFAHGGSPMANVASYYAAKAAFDQNRDVRDELSSVIARIDSREYRALAAHIHSQLAVNANRAGDRGTAVREAETASAIFHDLGERMNAAFTDGIAAYTLELIGDADPAWTRQVRALAAYCDDGSRGVCNGILNDTATTLAATGRGAAAVALARLAVDDATTPPIIVALHLAKRARVLEQVNDADALRATLAEARQAARGVTDSAARALAETQISVEEAALRSKHDPAAAIAALDRAVTFFSERDAAYLLPYVYLQRARARRAAGDRDGAASDYAAAMRSTAAQQSYLDDPALRAAFLDTETEAVDESVDLELSRGAAAPAFAIADRRHALAATVTAPRLDPNVAIVEYAVLPHSLAIFCLTGGHLSEETIAIDRNDLGARVETFVEEIRRRAPAGGIRGDAAALHRLLVAPIEPRLAGAGELVIVPDRQLYAVPFAALYDQRRQHFLVEDFVIRLAPAAAGPPSKAGAALTPALVVADPHVAGAPPLRGAREEAARIAALHGATLLTGDEATAERFAEIAPQAALIHYAGHANSDATTSYGALLLAGGHGVVSANEIRHLPLRRQPLVVLAACGTFRGDPAHVAGMSSIARAFLLAGARGVVGTLWEIDDDVSAPLLLRFHQALRAGASPARALREAQLAMLRSDNARLRDPATWSPLVDIENA